MAFVARTGLASPDQMSYFCGSRGRQHGHCCWVRRPINLSCLLALELLPARLAQLVTLSVWQRAAEGTLFPWARQGHSCPKSTVWQQARMRGCLWDLSIPLCTQTGTAKASFPPRQAEAASTGAHPHPPRGQDGSSSLAKLTLA